MRTVQHLAIALLAAAPIAASAAADPYSALNSVRAAYAQIHSVQIIERYGSGAVASVAYAPSQGAEEPAMAGLSTTSSIQNLALQPLGDPNVDLQGLFTVTDLGFKTINGEKLHGFALLDRAGAKEILWVNARSLPVTAHLQEGSQTLDVAYGNYDVPAYYATKS